MKILFLNRFFYPDHSATSQMLSDLAFFLSKHGHDVIVITSRLRYAEPRDQLPSFEKINGVAIYRVWTSSFGRHFLPGRTIDYLTFYLSAVWRLWRLADTNSVVVAKTDPPLVSVVAKFVVGVRKGYLVNWLQDLFPEVAIALRVRGFEGWLGRQLVKVRNSSLNHADMNVVIGDRMRDKLIREGIAPNKIQVIHNWADGMMITPMGNEGESSEALGVRSEGENSEELRVRSESEGEDSEALRVRSEGESSEVLKVRSERESSERSGVRSKQGKSEENPLRREWGLEGKFVVGYSGNLGRAHEFETIIDAAEKLNNDKEIVFLFVGSGAQVELVKQEGRIRKLGNLMFKPYQPREMLNQSLGLPDVHLVVLRPEMEGLIVPSKFYGIAAAGKPTLFIGNTKGEIAEIIKKHDAGLSIVPGDSDTLATSIRLLRKDPDKLGKMGTNARKAYDAEFDMDMSLEKWEETLKGLSCED